MAIQYVGGQAGNRAGANSTLTVNFALTGGLAAVPAAGDLVIVTCVVGSAARNAAQAVSGYTALGQLNSAAATNDTSMDVSYKFMGGTPDTSVVLPSTGNVADGQAYAIEVWRGVDPVTPLDVAAVSATGSGTGRPDPPAITPVSQGAQIIICGGGAAATGANYVAPANYTTGFLTSFGADTTDGIVGMGFRATTWTSGAENPAVFTGGTTNAADSWCAYTIALRPDTPKVLLTADIAGSGSLGGPLTAVPNIAARAEGIGNIRELLLVDTFSRTVATGAGTAESGTDTAKTWTTNAGADADVTVDDGALIILKDAGNWRALIGTVTSRDVDVYAEVTNFGAATQAFKLFTLYGRWVDGLTHYLFQYINDQSALDTDFALQIVKVIGGAVVQQSQIATTPYDRPAGGAFKLRGQIHAYPSQIVLRAKFWTSGAEPAAWDLTMTDVGSDRILSGKFAIRLANESAATDFRVEHVRIRALPALDAQVANTDFAPVTISGTSTVVGPLTGERQIAGTAAGTATVAAALRSVRDIGTGNPIGAGTLAATLLGVRSLGTGTAAGAGALAGTLSAAVAGMTAAINGAGVFTGVLTGLRTVGPTTINGLGTFTGAMTGRIALTAQISAAGILSALLGGRILLPPTTLSGLGVLAGALGTQGDATINALIHGLSTLTGAMNAEARVVAQVNGTGALSGVITRARTMDALASGLSTLQGVLSGRLTLEALSQGQAQLLADLSATVALEALIAGEGLLAGPIEEPIAVVFGPEPYILLLEPSATTLQLDPSETRLLLEPSNIGAVLT